MPPVEEHVLSDGTTVYIIMRPGDDLATVTFCSGTGSAHDRYPGSTAFAAGLLTRGTRRLSPEEWDEEVESKGSYITAQAGYHTFSVTSLCLAKHLRSTIELMSESISSPRFDNRELELLRDRWISELQMNERDPDWLANQACNHLCFPGHPYRIRRRGTIESMLSMSAEYVVEAHQRMLASPRYLIAAGNVSGDVLLPLAEDLVATMSAPSFFDNVPMAQPRTSVAEIALHPEAVQSALRISLPAVSYQHPDYTALRLATSVLGGSTLARMFATLREEKAYTYGAYATITMQPKAHHIDLMTNVGNEFTADTLDTIAALLNRMRTEPIAEDELDLARQTILGSFARNSETPQQTAALISKCLQYSLPFQFFEQHVHDLQTISSDEVFAVQQKYFDPSSWVIGCSGMADVLTSALEHHVSAIETWDVTKGG